MGSCTSHKRSFLSNSAYQYDEDDEQLSSSWHQKGLQIGLPCYMESSEHLPSLPDPSTTKQTNTSRACAKDGKSLPNTCASSLPDKHNRSEEISSKIDTGDLPKERTVQGSDTIAVDDNSISLLDTGKESVFARKIDSELNVAKRQSENLGLHVTSIPPEILDHFKRLKNTDNPETKEVAERLLDWITKLPSWENSKQSRDKSMISRSLDLDIFIKENSANEIGEILGLNDESDSFSMNTDSGGGGIVPTQYETSKILGTKPAGNSHDSMLKDDHHVELFEFSKKQIIKTRRESMLLSETLEKMPSLRLSLNNSRRNTMEEGSITDECMSIQDNAALEEMTSEIDELDKKVNKSMQKITALRRQSLDLLADGDDSGNSDDEKCMNISLLVLEKEIHRWQDHKSKLMDEREKVIAKLQSELIAPTPINFSPRKNNDYPSGVNMEGTELANIAVNSESPSTESNRCPTEDYTKITELN